MKNAAIVFLAVMLVLTFFSNTIMNRSLPEVAAQYTTSGTINARIRGSGMVAADYNYEVVLDQTRTVKDVIVRLDRAVEAGDLLFILSDAGSKELKDAQEALHNLLLTYERAVINAILTGDFASEERGIRIARENLDEARELLTEVEHESRTEIEKANAALVSTESVLASAETLFASAEAAESARKSVRDSAKSFLDSALDTEKTRAAAVATAQENLNSLGGLTPPNTARVEELNRSISEKNTEITQKEAELRVAEQMHKANYDLFVAATIDRFATSTSLPSGWNNEAQRAAYLEANAQFFGENDPLLTAYQVITGLNNKIRELNADLTSLRQERDTEQNKDNSSEYNRLNARLYDAKTAHDVAVTARESAERTHASADNALVAATEVRVAAEAERNAAEQKRNAADSDLKAVQDRYMGEIRQANDAVKSRQSSLEDLIFALNEQQKTFGVTDALHQIDMSELRRQIEEKRGEVNALEQSGSELEIISPVSGIVKQVNISPGNQTQPGMPMAVIEVLDRGYTLSFAVTLEQSRKVTVGDIAEIETWWWGGEIRAVLASIRNDPQNPAASRILTFDITGDITSDMQLNLSLGERSANYEVIVPNSAIRSDTNGDFVLVVLARSSPLGNRYIATRVDVSVLASDDTQSAVSGGLASWGDYVITTSNRPIEPGMQVRLVDNP